MKHADFFFFFLTTKESLGFPGVSVVKNLLAKQETRVWSLDQEDPLEKEMTTQSSILAWETPWTEGPGGLQSVGPQRIEHGLVTKQQEVTTAEEVCSDEDGKTHHRHTRHLPFSLTAPGTPWTA